MARARPRERISYDCAADRVLFLRAHLLMSAGSLSEMRRAVRRAAPIGKARRETRARRSGAETAARSPPGVRGQRKNLRSFRAQEAKTDFW